MDLEGNPRPCGPAVDLGAYELCEAPSSFLRGDASGDGQRTINDALVLLGSLFGAEPRALGCEKSADCNDDGALDLSDAVHLVNCLFLGQAIPDPWSGCGPDPTPDRLTCRSSPACR